MPSNDQFDKWYFGNAKGTYYKYSKEILADEEQLKNIRKSHEYKSMRTAWNAGFQFGIHEYESMKTAWNESRAIEYKGSSNEKSIVSGGNGGWSE